MYLYFLDVDECNTYENACDYKAGCQNTVGSYKCTCKAGYYLDEKKKCKGSEIADTIVYNYIEQLSEERDSNASSKINT